MDGADVDPSVLQLKGSAYSLRQRAFVAHTEEEVVWYDYDHLRKSAPEERHLRALWDLPPID